MSVVLTATEVAALCGVDEGRVRKDVEHGIFVRPTFAFADLVYFAVVSALGLHLDVEGRRKLHDVITKALGASRPPARTALSPVLELRLDRVTRDVEGRLGRFEAWKKKRVSVDENVLGGEPVFAKTRLAVRHVGGMLLGGAREEDVREDYPYLTDEDIDLAPVFTRAYPKMGRPRGREAPAR